MNGCSIELYQSFVNLPCWVKHCLVWVSQHQVLISGSAASIAAFFTIKRISGQMKMQTDFRKSDNETELKAALNAFAFKNIRFVDEVNRLSMHIDELKNDHPNQTQDNFYLIFQPILSPDISIPNVSDKDSHTLSKIDNLQIISDAMIVERYAKGLRAQLNHYEVTCAKLQEAAKSNMDLNSDGERLIASIEISEQENLEIIQLFKEKKHEADLVVSEVVAAVAFIEKYLVKLNPILKEYGIHVIELAKFEPSHK